MDVVVTTRSGESPSSDLPRSRGSSIPQPLRIPKLKKPKLPRRTRRCDTFAVFPQLPTDLRRKIWILTLPGPQVISIYDHEFLDHGLWKRRAVAQYKIPALLHCSRESRLIAQSHYTKAFEALLSGIPVYINFEKDLLHFNSPWALLHMGGFTRNYNATDVNKFFKTVRYVSMSEIDCLFKTVGYLLSRFEALNTLILLGVKTKTDDDLMNFYMPLGRVSGGFVAMEDLMGLVVETRTELMESRDELATDGSDEGKDALLLINSVATMKEVKTDWEKNFDVTEDEKHAKERNASKKRDPSQMEYWKIEN